MFNLQRKIIFLAVVPTMIILLMTIGTIESVGKRLAYESFRRTASAQFFTVAGLIDAFFRDQINALKLVSNSDAIRSGDNASRLKFLRRQYRFFSNLKVEGIYWFEKSGFSHGVFGEEFYVGDRPYFTHVLEGKVVISAIRKSRATEKPIILFLVPFFSPTNEVLGGIASAVYVEDIAKLIIDATPQEASFVALHDMEANEILVASRRQGKDALTFQPVATYEEKQDLEGLIKAMVPQAHGVIDVTYKGQDYVAYFGNLPGLNWSLALNYPRAWVLFPTSQIRNYALFALFASVALGLFSIFILHQLFVTPIREIMQGFAELGRGNLEASVPVPARKDEIADLAQAFNATVKNFRRSFEDRLEAVQAKENILAIFESTPDYIAIANKEGRVTYFNPAARQTFKYSAEEMGRLQIPDYYAAPSKEIIFKIAIPQALRTGIWEGETEVQTRDGRIVTLSQVIMCHKKAGQPSFFSTIARDISGLKNAESEALLAKDKMAAAMQLRDIFLLTVSHELMTPLMTLTGSLDLIEAEVHGVKCEADFTVAWKAARRLESLLSLIIRFMDVVSGKFSLELVDFRIDKLVEVVAASFSQGLEERNLTWIMTMTPQVHPFVRGDRQKIQEILAILIGNAVKFTLEGAVRIKLEQLQKKGAMQVLRIDVIDYGMGIDKANQAKIFDPFYQVDASLTREYHGLGLGLAYCKELVKVLNGQIGVESELGRGSCFWVTLPLEIIQE